MVEVRKYRDGSGHIPFDLWLEQMRDRRALMRVKVRVDRLALGLEGDWKSVGGDVRELRIREGKGYRVYYGWDGDAVVILLCGGDKRTQSRDIDLAQQYWRDYRDQL